MKNYVKMTLVIFLAYLMTFFLGMLVQYRSSLDKVDISDQITTQILRTDGTIDSHTGPRFPVLNKGDRLSASIPIPADTRYDSPMLSFGITNCSFKVMCEGRLVYEYGSRLAREGHHIGSVQAVIPFSEDAIGSQLKVYAEATENRAAGEFVNVSYMPSIEGRHWLISANLSIALFLVTIATTSFMVMVILMLSDGRKKFVRLSLWLLFFLLLVAIYRLATTGIIFSMLGNCNLCSNLEYAIFFALPIPILAFCVEFCMDRKSRGFVSFLLVLQVALFSAATILNFSTRDYHYARFLIFQHVLILISILSVCIIARKSSLYERDSDSSKCMINGLENFFLFVLLDTLRFYIRKYTAFQSPLLDLDFLFVGILLMSASFTMSIFLKVTRVFLEKNQKNYYEHLAYTDIMTGLGNRTLYYENITQMRLEHTEIYTIFFMDLNNLKEVNDRFGHEYGDLYIKAAAKSIHLAFHDADASFRIGGDEFLVIYRTRIPANPHALCDTLKATFDRICEEQEFPFRGSIACGISESNRNSAMDIENAVKLADASMYEDKERIKEKYGRHCRIVGEF